LPFRNQLDSNRGIKSGVFCRLGLPISVFAGLASAQKVDLVARVRGLNNDLLGLHSELSRTPPEQGASLRSQAAATIQQRAAALSALIQEDPGQALSFAFAPETLADLAAALPESASQLGSN